MKNKHYYIIVRQIVDLTPLIHYIPSSLLKSKLNMVDRFEFWLGVKYGFKNTLFNDALRYKTREDAYNAAFNIPYKWYTNSAPNKNLTKWYAEPGKESKISVMEVNTEAKEIQELKALNDSPMLTSKRKVFSPANLETFNII